MTPKPTLDAVDRRIVAALGRDARLSVRQLAEQVHVSRSAAHARLTRLMEEGVITGFHAAVDREKLGLALTALVIVKVDTDWSSVSDALAALPFVERVQALGGDVDILLTVNAPDHEALSETILRRIHTTPGVASTRSYIVLAEKTGTPPEQSTDIWQL